MPTNTDVLLAGALAAFTVDLLVYPLDTLKTRLQSPSHRNLPRFTGLYQGAGSVVLATLPASGAFFTTYEACRRHLPRSHLSNALASSAAELVSCSILTPSEVIKQNAQVLSTTTPGASASLRALRNIKHVRDLWAGYTVLAGRNLPFTALQFPVFEVLKKRFVSRDAGTAGTVAGAGIAAGISGAGAAVLTTPVDVVKTRIMLRSDERPGVRAVVREVWRQEGIRGLWRGGGLRGIWTAVGSGLYLGVYEGAKVWLGRRREEDGALVDL